MNSTCDSHYDVMVRIIRYIKWALGKGLVYIDKGNLDIVVYIDVDWADVPLTGGPRVRIVFLLVKIKFHEKVSRMSLPDLVLKLNVELCHLTT